MTEDINAESESAREARLFFESDMYGQMMLNSAEIKELHGETAEEVEIIYPAETIELERLERDEQAIGSVLLGAINGFDDAYDPQFAVLDELDGPA